MKVAKGLWINLANMEIKENEAERWSTRNQRVAQPRLVIFTGQKLNHKLLQETGRLYQKTRPKGWIPEKLIELLLVWDSS